MKASLLACALAACLVAGTLGKAAPAAAAGRAGDKDIGFLDVSSDPPGAKILIDDTDTGRTTPQHHLPVKAGHHLLTLVASDSGSKFPVGFTVEAGQTKKLTLHLAK
jgi:hypothetical protein